MSALTLRIPDHIVAELDKFIDGMKFRSRTQLLTLILLEWIKLPDNEKIGSVWKKSPYWEAIGTRKK